MKHFLLPHIKFYVRGENYTTGPCNLNTLEAGGLLFAKLQVVGAVVEFPLTASFPAGAAHKTQHRRIYYTHTAQTCKTGVGKSYLRPQRVKKKVSSHLTGWSGWCPGTAYPRRRRRSRFARGASVRRPAAAMPRSTRATSATQCAANLFTKRHILYATAKSSIQMGIRRSGERNLI